MYARTSVSRLTFSVRARSVWMSLGFILGVVRLLGVNGGERMIEERESVEIWGVGM